MIFQVVSPFTANIYGDSLKEAIKNYIKINRNMKVNQMIVADQSNHYQAYMKYYKEDIRNKVGINIYPIASPYGFSGAVAVNNNNNMATYVPQTVVQTPVVPTVVSQFSTPFLPMSQAMSSPLYPIEMSLITSAVAPFTPTIIDIPRGL